MKHCDHGNFCVYSIHKHHKQQTLSNLQISTDGKPKTLFLVPYSWKFLNGANFCILQTHTNCAKIRTNEYFWPRLRDYPILSYTETFCLLRCSRCPCKYGSCLSSPCVVKEAYTMSRKVRISPTCVSGGVA